MRLVSISAVSATSAEATAHLSSPIKPFAPIDEGIVGPTVFTDLENYQHPTGFSIYVPSNTPILW